MAPTNVERCPEYMPGCEEVCPGFDTRKCERLHDWAAEQDPDPDQDE